MRTRTVHRCRECGDESPRWLGRCPSCGEWGTLVEAAAPSLASVSAGLIGPAGGPVPIGEVSANASMPMPTGVGELDRVLGGGLVPGSVTLLAGEPGMGKSTLLLQALGQMAARGARCLLVTAEESCAQVRTRAERVGALAPNLLVVAETSLPHVVAHTEACAPQVLALDSIQTVLDPDLPGAPGSVTQVRDCAYRLVQQAKERELATVLIGHVTKEGTLAGPRVLEHVVDTVLSVDGDRGHSLRLLHALKHRFGSTHELGLFEMTALGLVDVPDASARFLVDRREGVPDRWWRRCWRGAAVVGGGAGVGGRRRRAAAALRGRSRQRAPRPDPRGALAAWRGAARLRRRLREHRRWPARHRARPRSRRRARGRERAWAARSHPAPSWSGSSVSVGKCGRCRRPSAASRRPRDSDSHGRSCLPARRRSRASMSSPSAT